MAKLKMTECIHVIKDFGVCIVQSLLGGEILPGNHPSGDIYHKDELMYLEVKTCGLSAGAIIVGEQLFRHWNDQISRDYIFVFYKNRGTYKGRYGHLPVRIAKSKDILENFLINNIREVYVVPIEIVHAFYEKYPNKIKEYMMQRGLKRYMKISRTDLQRLMCNPMEIDYLGIRPLSYVDEERKATVRFKGKRVPVVIKTLKLNI